jgi:hypothetical protein
MPTDPIKRGAIEIRKFPTKGIFDFSCSTKPPDFEKSLISLTRVKVIKQKIRCESS